MRQPTTPAKLTLLTRPNCHLCEAARTAMTRVAAATRTPWTELDISDNAELEYEYGDRIPVVLLNGAEHGFWRVEEERLIQDLNTP